MESKITWTNEKRKLSDLIPWPRNPRQIKSDQAKRLVESFDTFGQVETIAIGPGNDIYNGHQRLNVLAQQYGKDYEVEVRVSSRPLSEKEREKLTVFLHKGAAGEWDFDTLANEFELDDLLEWGFDKKELDLDLWAGEPQEDPGAQIDRAEELREKWGVESGQMWKLGEHRLICGDCTDRATVKKVMRGEKAQFCVTSPPYPGAEMWETEADKLISLGVDCLNLLKDILFSGAALAWNTCDVPCGQTGVAPNAARDTMLAVGMGWTKRAEIIWEKGLSYLPAPWNTRRPTVPNETHESIIIFYNGERVPREKDGNLSDTALGWNRETVWKITPAKAKETNHIAAFPIELAERCITLFSFDGDIVYEPFLGSGTTLIACERLNRKCRAVEISPAYCAVAIQRWVDMTGGTPELIEQLEIEVESR